MIPRGEIMKIEDAIKMLEAIKTEHGNLDITKAFYSRHDWAEVEKLYKNGGTMYRYGHGNTPVKVVALY